MGTPSSEEPTTTPATEPEVETPATEPEPGPEEAGEPGE